MAHSFRAISALCAFCRFRICSGNREVFLLRQAQYRRIVRADCRDPAPAAVRDRMGVLPRFIVQGEQRQTGLAERLARRVSLTLPLARSSRSTPTSCSSSRIDRNRGVAWTHSLAAALTKLFSSATTIKVSQETQFRQGHPPLPMTMPEPTSRRASLLASANRLRVLFLRRSPLAHLTLNRTGAVIVLLTLGGGAETGDARRTRDRTSSSRAG